MMFITTRSTIPHQQADEHLFNGRRASITCKHTQKVQKRRRWQSKRNNNNFSEVHFYSDGNQAYCFPSYFMFIIDFLPFMKAAVFIIKTSVSCSSSTWHTVSTDELLMLKHCSGAVLDLTGCVQYRPQRHTQLLKLRAGDSGPHTTITLVVRTEITETFWWKVDCFILRVKIVSFGVVYGQYRGFEGWGLGYGCRFLYILLGKAAFIWRFLFFFYNLK